eukprot:NODE_269_length_12236_cov_0.516932.p11 type:complete len:103 gc:universal NODE_269_length_12236_cov_0.516932:10341-10033(-)
MLHWLRLNYISARIQNVEVKAEILPQLSVDLGQDEVTLKLFDLLEMDSEKIIWIETNFPPLPPLEILSEPENPTIYSSRDMKMGDKPCQNVIKLVDYYSDSE